MWCLSDRLSAYLSDCPALVAESCTCLRAHKPLLVAVHYIGERGMHVALAERTNVLNFAVSPTRPTIAIYGRFITVFPSSLHLMCGVSIRDGSLGDHTRSILQDNKSGINPTRPPQGSAPISFYVVHSQQSFRGAHNSRYRDS